MFDHLENLVSSLEEKGFIRTPRIRQAFLAVDRADFVLPEYRDQAYWDIALPLISGQTISQPLTVSFMLELLQPLPGQKILDVGSGSGYTSALLASIVGPEGLVLAMERLPELEKLGEENVKRSGQKNIRMTAGNGAKGWPYYAPFDRILVNAAAPDVPGPLRQQLKNGGKLVMPSNDAMGNIILLEKDTAGICRESRYPGFTFVPFIDD